MLKLSQQQQQQTDHYPTTCKLYFTMSKKDHEIQ